MNKTPAATDTPRAGARRRPLAVAGLALLLLVGAGGATAWLRARAAAVPVAPNAAAVQSLELLAQDLATVAAGEIRQSIRLTGSLQPLNRVEVKAPLPGQVVSVMAREGDRVRRGQVLATLDSADLQARLRDRQAALAGGQAQLALAGKTRENNQALLRQDFISQAAFDNSLSGYQTAESGVTSLQAQVQQARKALADAVVRSPLDGVIAERIAEPGLSVPVNATLLVVQDLTQMELEVLVPTSQIPAVRIGQRASFQIEGFGDRRFDGQVERIAPSAAAGARSIAVYLRLANPEQQLRGGMFAQGQIVTGSRAQVLLVPASALRETATGALVLRIDGQTLAEQAVQLGERDADSGLVEVTGGLKAGDRVVLSTAANLRAGLPVQVVQLPQPAAAPPPAKPAQRS